ncbi:MULTISPECIES: polysaccharide biosynthesis/export family protein [unclassified Flavobacterium]|uniref:polysaccharide biosynthesis/export family protein n=1 Tax=unclassified Flavobacterium TaxID=196869 RepID=UPI001F13442E|nr:MULTISPECIES: polysaccharide biosynthesis/export family protein [unclassified Flavobacterium]UMY65853.1 polysaccharide biosynthesis/export family protein [Flavobacterium sp. HJ-32-4]
MKYRALFLLVFFAGMMTSCIPNEDLIYLQKKQEADNMGVHEVPSKPYRLQTSDNLYIAIKSLDPQFVAMFNSTESAAATAISQEGLYFNGYAVDDHGNIRIPILGELNVLGFTVDEVRKRIEDRLLETYFTKDANIFVTVKLTGFRFTVNGEVNVPGTKTLFQEKVNVLEAIANAGDIPTTGDRKHVSIIRKLPHGTEMYEIDLTDKASLSSPYFELQPNDYVYVKPLKQKSWGTGRTGIESISTVVMLLSLATTGLILLRNN